MPLSYNMRNLKVRWQVTLLAVLGIALVVAVFIVLAAMASGFRLALAGTGVAENAMIVQRGSTSELTSGIPRSQISLLAIDSRVSRDAEGRALASPEHVIIFNATKKADGQSTNVLIRGVTPMAFVVRHGIRIVEGRTFSPGLYELIVGTRIRDRVNGLDLGSTIKIARRDWTVVGVFSSEGSGFESEVWGDADAIGPAFNRSGGFSSLAVRLADPSTAQAFDQEIQHNPQMQLQLTDPAGGAHTLVLGGPMLTARWGGVDETVLPASAPSRVAADLQTEWFGGEQSTAEIVVRGGSAADQAAFLSDLASTPGVDYVVPLTSRTIHGELSALVQAAWSGNSQLESSQQVVRDLREVAAPAGVTAEVGGSTADTVDLVHAIVSTLPWMGLLVAVVMFVLLFVAFGSLVLPAKAIVMNTVSIAASFGVVTWVFQDGHLSGPLGFTAQGYLDATQPILMLAVLFGLSMDYEVFLLSRIREDWDATGDNTQAVAAGLQHTGRIITSAALLLAVVIGGFATSGIVFIKMLGLGMLVAVLLDATIVRALLVPATMRLLGGLNWWAPGPLRHWWERWGHGRPAPAPEPASEPAPVAVTGT